MAAAREVGADRVELYTESYAQAFAQGQQNEVLAGFGDAALAAIDAGLGVNAGHDLSQANLPLFLQTVPGVLEVSIGHAFIADALELGYAQATQCYLAAIAQGHGVAP
jgi:pyridoxine 5-phosphate synthase